MIVAALIEALEARSLDSYCNLPPFACNLLRTIEGEPNRRHGTVRCSTLGWFTSIFSRPRSDLLPVRSKLLSDLDIRPIC